MARVSAGSIPVGLPKAGPTPVWRATATLATVAQWQSSGFQTRVVEGPIPSCRAGPPVDPEDRKGNGRLSKSGNGIAPYTRRLSALGVRVPRRPLGEIVSPRLGRWRNWERAGIGSRRLRVRVPPSLLMVG